MKILQLTYALSAGGAERFIVDLCNELSRNPQNEVTLLSIVDDTVPSNCHYKGELSDNVSYHCLGLSKGISVNAMIDVYRFVKQKRPDVVHSHASALLLFISALLYTKCKYVFTFHSLVFRRVELPTMKFIYKWFFGTNRITPVTISNQCHQSYIDFFNDNHDKCIINGRSLLPKTEKLNHIREQIESYKGNANEPVFVHVARADDVKNHKLLLSSFAKLEQEGVKFQLIIVGERYEENGYTSYASKQIHFMGVQKNVGDYLACGEYFVLSSLKEGLPLSLLEAMSFGLIPVCTPAGGICDVVRNGVNGFLSANCTSADDFCDTIRKALDNRSAISHASIINDWKDKYSMEQCALNYYKEYIND